MEKLPRYQELIDPLVVFLKTHDGPATNKAIDDAVAKILMIPPTLLLEIHSGKRTEFQYRMAWARTKAKSDGKISSPKRETWQII
jgi:restriction endonuclease Mrr